jgi:hypothetical protein
MEEIEDRLLDQVRSDPLVAKRLEEVDLHERLSLKELQEHEGWQLQRERFAHFKELVIEKLSKRLMRGDHITREEIAFQRGYAAGVEDIFEWPERVEVDLGNAALRAWDRAMQGLTPDSPRQP